MAKKADKLATEIKRNLDRYQAGEDSLDVAVHLSLSHAVIHTAPDQLNNVHAYLIANGNTQLASRYRDYVRQCTVWIWNDNKSTFSYRKAVANNWEDHADDWNRRLGENWRVLEEAASKPKKRRTFDSRVDAQLKASRKEGHIPAAEMNNAVSMLINEMSDKQLLDVLGERFDKLIARAYPEPKAA